ncbi:hypothetical protein FS837_005456 [Tulasnella sp. UAMH 9824]|nr:hypothetical protein FS837_005456 [Tulasnella sp. UAMH 9824]
MRATLKPGAAGSETPVEAAARRLQVDKTKTESTVVASASVLITEDGRAVLSDINLYTLVNRVQLIGSSHFDGLVHWFSPESLTTSDRTTHSDIWAWGCLALEMMTGEYPYPNFNTIDDTKEQILSGRTPEPHPPPRNWPEGLLELVRKCWSFKPEDRPNVRTSVESVNIILSLIEQLREEVNVAMGGSFISGERIQPGPNQTVTLREAEKCATKTAELLPSGVSVVVKTMSLQEIDSVSSRADFLKCLARLTAVLPTLKHINILEFIGYSVRGYFEAVALVTPRMANGNLVDHMQKDIDMNGKLQLARGAIDGLHYLHAWEPPVVHGNVTPFNVLIDETGTAVLSDVGWTSFDWHPITAPKASARWSSPEVNLGESPVVQSDIWSWACVVLQLVTGDLPYSFLEDEDRIKALMSRGKRGRLTPEAFHDLDEIPDSLMQLLRQCWEFDLSQRPTAGRCIETLNLMLIANPDGAEQAHTSGIEEQAAILSLDDDISRLITSVSPQAICINGRFGDVFKGSHKTLGEVALKRLRIGAAALDEQVIRRFEREADTWRRLNHPHVLKFLGTYKPGAHLYFVSPFAANGTLLEYVSVRPAVNRIRLLFETSDAVDYLHREDIVHGDIKASNLLISDGGHVLLCDFGLAKSTYAQTSTALKGAGTFRWQSPELWNNEPRSFASDIYAFSMTIVEVVLSGLPPFSHLENEVAVFMAVYQMDARPLKTPTEFNGVSYENVWKVAEACWPKAPGDRKSMSEARLLLKADPSLA